MARDRSCEQGSRQDHHSQAFLTLLPMLSFFVVSRLNVAKTMRTPAFFLLIGTSEVLEDGFQSMARTRAATQAIVAIELGVVRAAATLMSLHVLLQDFGFIGPLKVVHIERRGVREAANNNHILIRKLFQHRFFLRRTSASSLTPFGRLIVNTHATTCDTSLDFVIAGERCVIKRRCQKHNLQMSRKPKETCHER
jgi:hypothetical protein